MRPSWAVTKAPVIRNVRKATVQKMNIDGPAACVPAELMMNRTIATKTTTRSNGPSVLATRTGATFSEIIACSSVRLAMEHPFLWRCPLRAGGPPPAHVAPESLHRRQCFVQLASDGPAGAEAAPGEVCSGAVLA